MWPDLRPLTRRSFCCKRSGNEPHYREYTPAGGGPPQHRRGRCLPSHATPRGGGGVTSQREGVPREIPLPSAKKMTEIFLPERSAEKVKAVRTPCAIRKPWRVSWPFWSDQAITVSFKWTHTRSESTEQKRQTTATKMAHNGSAPRSTKRPNQANCTH